MTRRSLVSIQKPHIESENLLVIEPLSIHSNRPALFVAAAALALLACGCGPRHPTADPVNADTARQTLQSVLESWQRGEALESWQQRDPKVVVQDSDWSAGAKLKEFEILGVGEPRDANLYCQVKLVLDGPGRGKQPQTVTYVVGTDPVLTVFRDMFH